MTKFETLPDSPPITVIDPDDQPMWSSTRNVAPTPSSAIFQLPIHNFHIKDDPTQEILDAGGIFLFNTPNEAFKILEDKDDVKTIKEDEIEPIPSMPNPNLINYNSLTVSPFLKDCTVHIPYTNAKMFADKEFKLIVGIGIGRMPKIKKDDMAGSGGGCLEEKSIELTSLC
ncbi:hypothetical protein Tco_0490905 [Tanacetum coccineum]